VADDILRQAVQGISDIITIPGIINRDFADVKTIMAGMGYAVMGTATAKGEGRATAAAQAAIASPLLEAGAIDGARGILINITGSNSLRLAEVNEASSIIQSAAHEDANIIFGAVLDEKMKDEVKITVIATGFKEVLGRRAPTESATTVRNTAARTASASVHATYEVAAEIQPIVETKTPATPRPIRAVDLEPPQDHQQAISYIADDLEMESEIVRHAEPVEEMVLRPNVAAETAETVSSSVDINYNSDDLEIPAFLRKRAEA
jgi:cell division protein FtsZ